MASLLDSPRSNSYDRIRVAYDLIAAPAERSARERALALLDAGPGERVLEIGTGTGRALASLAKTAAPRGVVCGLDASAGMLRLARRRLSRRQARAYLQQGDGRSLPYLPSSFDAVFMSFTLELFDPLDIERVLREIRRVLRPEGRLIIVCLMAMPEPSPIVRGYEWLHAHLPQLIDCRPIDVVRALHRSGYSPSRMETMSLWGLPVTAIAATSPPCP